jgi:hypothetical protein
MEVVSEGALRRRELIVFGILVVGCHTAADSQDVRPVPFHEQLEGLLVPRLQTRSLNRIRTEPTFRKSLVQNN